MYDFNCDVKLKIGKQTFRAHRDILSEASQYFEAMFGHNMKEKDQDVIEFYEISPEGFTLMLEYLYHGHVTLSTENTGDLLESARFFHIEWLIKVCCDYLIRHMSLSNYHNVLHLADKFFLGDVRHDIFRFIGQNFMTLGQQSKFMDLSPDLFIQLLTEDYFIDATEYYIFQTAVKWSMHKPERAEYMTSLLQLIRYPLIDKDQLERMPENVLEVPELKEMVDEAIEYQSYPSKQCLMTSDLTEVRGGKDVVMLISALDDAHLIQYKIPGISDFFSEEINSSFLESVFEFTSVAELGNFVFIGGGYDRHTWCSTPSFYRYNPRNRVWGRLSSMNHARVSFALCSAPNGLYAVAGIDHIVEAGHDHETILSTVEFYDPQQGVWTFIPSLPCGCFSIAAVTSADTLYVSGGITDDTEDTIPVNKMQAYTPGDDTWVPKAPMIMERQGHALTALNNKIYVFGGYTAGPDTVSFDHSLTSEVYDIETNQWSLIHQSSIDLGHIHASICKFDQHLYMLGGKEADRMLVCFDPEKGTDEVEYCGQHVQRLVQIRVAFPFDVE